VHSKQKSGKKKSGFSELN